jgi:hypothetical protein
MVLSIEKAVQSSAKQCKAVQSSQKTVIIYIMKGFI